MVLCCQCNISGKDPNAVSSVKQRKWKQTWTAGVRPGRNTEACVPAAGFVLSVFRILLLMRITHL